MGNVRKPATQREMTEQLWFAVVGSNGEGIASLVRRNAEAIEKLERHIPSLVTRAEIEAEKERRADADAAWQRFRQERRQKRLSIVIAALAVVVPSAIALLGSGA